MKKRIVLGLMLLSGGISTVQAKTACYTFKKSSLQAFKKKCDKLVKDNNTFGYVTTYDAGGNKVTLDRNGKYVRYDGKKAVSPFNHQCCIDVKINRGGKKR